MFMVVVLFLVIVVVVAWKATYPPQYRYVKDIPGPPDKPIFGQALHLSKESTAFTQQFYDWYKQYSSPLRLKFGNHYQIHLYKGEHLEVLCKSNANITKSEEYDYVRNWLGTGLLTSTGEKWQYRRHLLTPSFHFGILKRFVSVFNDQALILIDILSQDAQSKRDEAINISPYVTNCTLDIICESAMGKKLESQRGQSPEYVQALARFSWAVNYRAFRPWLIPDIIWNRTAMGKQSIQDLKIMHDFTFDVIRQRDAEERPELGETSKARLAFLDMLLAMKDKGELTIDDIREEVDTFMFEGHDTTAHGIMWALYFIGAHQDCQEKIYEEMLEQLGPDLPNFLNTEQVASLQYFERFLKETQRIMPSVPLVARKVTEEFQIDNYTIPVGVTCNLAIAALHRDPEVYPNPLVFDPDRFLPENAEGRNPFAFLPFSAGPRNCIGQRFALLEEKIVLYHFVKNFNIEAVQSFEELKPVMELVLKPYDGLWLKLKRRS